MTNDRDSRRDDPSGRHRPGTPKGPGKGSKPGKPAKPVATKPVEPPSPQEALARLEQATASDLPAEVEPDPYARRTRVVLYLVIAVSAILVGGFGFVAGYTIVETRQNSADIDQIAADAAGGAVGANRGRATGEVRGDPAQSCAPELPESYTLECANRERVAVGLEPILAPDGLGPSQIAGLMGEARADLRQVLREREGSRPGVSTPDQGRFRTDGAGR